MKASRIIAVVGVLGILAVLFIAAVKPTPAATFVHTTKKGESLSLICIQYYGYYSTDLGAAVLTYNQSIKDINVILVGQKLTLPTPRESVAAKPGQHAGPAGATVAAASAPSSAPSDSTTAALFEKRIDATQGVVTCVEGGATLVPRNGQGRQSLTVNTVVYPGDMIETAADGRVEIIINRESVVRLKEQTRLVIEAFRDNVAQKGKTKLGFTLGTVWSKVRKFKDAVSRFELELPTAVAGVHGTVYQTSVATDSSAEVKVFDGEVAVNNRSRAASEGSGGLSEVAAPDEVAGPSEVSMEAWTEIVRAMQKISIDKKGKPSSVQPFIRNAASSWEQWNTERDKRVAELFAE